MGQYLCIRFRSKNDPGPLQLLLQIMVVFNDAIMDDEHVLILIPVRMGILFARFAVCGPAGVCYTGCPLDVHVIYLGFQFQDLSHGPVIIDMVTVLNGQPC